MNFYNDYYDASIETIKLQGEIDSLCIALKYILKILNQDQTQTANTFINMVSIREQTKQQLYDSRITENRENKARTNAETIS